MSFVWHFSKSCSLIWKILSLTVLPLSGQVIPVRQSTFVTSHLTRAVSLREALLTLSLRTHPLGTFLRDRFKFLQV